MSRRTVFALVPLLVVVSTNATARPPQLCPRSDAGEVTCLALKGEELVLEDMIGNRACSFMSLSRRIRRASTASLLRMGDQALLCLENSAAVYVDRAFDEVRVLNFECRAAWWYDNEVWVLQSDGRKSIHTYPSLAAVDRDTGKVRVPDFRMQASRFAFSNGILYGAWHATDKLERFDVERLEHLTPRFLGNYRGWVHGMGVADREGGPVVIFNGHDRERIVIDAGRGRILHPPERKRRRRKKQRYRVEPTLGKLPAVGRHCFTTTVSRAAVPANTTPPP